MRPFARLRDWFATGRNPDWPLEIHAFPPPFQSMLAINSDVEWTNWPLQIALLKACAARRLETSFSFWMYASPTATWRLLESDGGASVHARAAAVLGRAGLLDTLHSIGGRRHAGGCRHYGREQIAAAYAFLEAEGWPVHVYTNHGSTEDRQNIGDVTFATYHEGDELGAALYHLDITVRNGLRFFWCDPDYTSSHPRLAAELDTPEALFVSGRGRDGTAFLRFRRWLGAGLVAGPSLDNLSLQISDLLARPSTPGYAVIYQHLGVERDADGRPHSATFPLRADALAALDQLAEAQQEGRFMVTTTQRLLTHAAVMAARPWTTRRTASGTIIVDFDDVLRLGDVTFSLTSDDLRGWTAAAPADRLVSARFQGQPLSLEQTDGSSGMRLHSLPWAPIDMHTAITDAEAAFQNGAAR